MITLVTHRLLAILLHGLAMLVILSLMLSHVAAQDQTLRFVEVEGIAGKPLGKLRNITQDPSGQMWFSGEDARCLYRYDGSTLTEYRHDFTNPTYRRR